MRAGIRLVENYRRPPMVGQPPAYHILRVLTMRCTDSVWGGANPNRARATIMEATHFLIGLFGCMATCWMTARWDDYPAGRLNGWLFSWMVTSVGRLPGGRAV